MADELVLSVLREIRDETRATRTELSARIDTTNERLGNVEETLVDLAEQQRFVTRWLRASTRRDRAIEGELADLRARVDVLETRRER